VVFRQSSASFSRWLEKENAWPTKVFILTPLIGQEGRAASHSHYSTSDIGFSDRDIQAFNTV
jgi:hypothetical protein